MITLIAFILGLLIGAFRARKRGRPMGDQIQWALVHGIFLGLATMIIGTIYLNLAG